MIENNQLAIQNATLRDENAVLLRYLQRVTAALQEALDAAPVLAGWEAMYHIKRARKLPREKGLQQKDILEDKELIPFLKYSAILSARDDALRVLESKKNGVENEHKENPVKHYKDESDWLINTHNGLSIKLGNTFKWREPSE